MVQSLPEKPLVALQSVLQEIREQSDSQVMVDLALNYIRQVFVAPLIWLALYDYDGHQLVGQGGVTLLDDSSLLTSVHPLQPGEIMEQVVIEQRPISLPDMSQEPRMGVWQREAQNLGGIQGCMIYPIQHQRRCMGILMLGSQVWGVTTTDEEKALLSILLGQLAASVAQLEVIWQRQMEKRVDEPLALLSKALREVSTTAERASAATLILQDFVAVSRVEIYWLDRKQNYFIPQSGMALPVPSLTSGSKSQAPKPTLTIGLRELGDLYYSLQKGQLILATEASGSARSDVPPKLMQQLRVQAILMAPIILEGDLLGFIAAESDVPRAWQEPDRQMMTTAANLIALSQPLEQLQVTTERVEQHLDFVGQLVRDAFAYADMETALQNAIQTLCDRLEASGCLVLVYRPISQTFSAFFEYRRDTRLSLPRQLGPLNDQDWADLMKGEAVAAENYSQDLRLLSWRAEIEAAGIKALMLSHTGNSQVTTEIDGAILILNQQVRAWTREERQLLRAVAQQLGVMMRQSEAEKTMQRQEQLLNGVINTASIIQSLQSMTDVYSVTTERAAQILNAPMAAIVSWLPGETVGYLQAPYAAKDDFRLTAATEIDIYADPLIAECLQSETGVIEFRSEALAPTTQKWLTATGLGWGLATPLGLQDGYSAPVGILIVGDQVGSQWEPDEQTTLILIGHTCGWTVRRLLWTQTLQQQTEILRELNWYKHRRLFEFQNALLENLRRLGQVKDIPGDEAIRWQKVVEIARGLRDLTVPTQSLLKSEAWDVQLEIKGIPVASLIRRILRKLDAVVQQRKLWPRVHGDTGFGIYADSGRVEMILYEVIMAAILRSAENSRLDMWVQEGNDYAEILVVDEGQFDGTLLDTLQLDPEQAIYTDPLTTSVLSVSPGLELSLCQRIAIRMGGELSFYQAQDGRNISRLMMPIMTDNLDDFVIE